MTELEKFYNKLSISSANLSIIVLLIVLIIGYNGLFVLFHFVRVLPEKAYQSPIIFIEAIQNIPFFLVLVVPFAILVFERKTIRWSELAYGRKLRWFILFVSLPLVYTYTTYEYNLFYEQAHHVDRILLLTLYILIWRHPLFIYPFTLLVLMVIGQFINPLGDFALADKALPKNILILFSSFLFLKVRNGYFIKPILDKIKLFNIFDPEIDDEWLFIWVAAGIIGGSYFTPFLSKSGILWPLREPLYYYIPLKYVWGWLGHLDHATIMSIFAWMKVLNPIPVWSTFVIEGGAIALMWRKVGFKTLIGSFVVLHLAIFLASGIAFWKWVIVLLSFLTFILWIDCEVNTTVFNKRTATIVTVLIILSPMIFHVSALGWYSTNYQESYSVELVTEDGEIYEMHWSDMEPYTSSFGSNRFSHIDNGTALNPGQHVTKDYKLVLLLENSNGMEDVEDVREIKGQSSYDPVEAAKFDRFLCGYFRSYLEGQHEGFIWAKASIIPPHFWSTANTVPVPQDKNYTHIQVRKTQYLVTGNEIKTDSKIIRKISCLSSS